MEIKVKLEALDGVPITPRTGKSEVVAITGKIPEEGGTQCFFYVNENCESPGVHISTDCVEKIGNEIRFFNYEKRPFKMTIIS